VKGRFVVVNALRVRELTSQPMSFVGRAVQYRQSYI